MRNNVSWISVVDCRILLLVAVMLFGAACSRDVKCSLSPDFEKRGIVRIAIMPVENRSDDEGAARLLRAETFEKLYFKGYPKIPFEVIDGRLDGAADRIGKSGGEPLPPAEVAKLIDVDAVMYCTLEEWSTSPLLVHVYAPTAVAVTFELKSAASGEMLWCTRHRVVERNYYITENGLKIQSCESYGEAVREIVAAALSTLPDGPDYLGELKSNTGLWELW